MFWDMSVDFHTGTMTSRLYDILFLLCSMEESTPPSYKLIIILYPFGNTTPPPHPNQNPSSSDTVYICPPLHTPSLSHLPPPHTHTLIITPFLKSYIPWNTGWANSSLSHYCRRGWNETMPPWPAHLLCCGGCCSDNIITLGVLLSRWVGGVGWDEGVDFWGW